MNSTYSTSDITDDFLHEHFDHLSSRLAGPFNDVMARMRTACPVARSDQHGGFWILTRYEDVLRVAQDWETFSSAEGVTIPRNPVAVRSIPVDIDPPLHRVYKRLINHYFTASAVAVWEEPTRQAATRLIDSFITAGECEFMDAFARPFPAQAFFELTLAAPRDQIVKVAHMASKSSIPTDPEARACWAGLSQWVNDFVEERRAAPPRGDVVDGVLDAQIEGRPITREEIVGIVQLLILGGLETTAGALGLAMLRFFAQPEIPARLRERPDLIPKAVEELLRLDTPFLSISRTATREVEIGGHSIKKGDRVLLYWASANRDEAEFPDAVSFELEREPNRHLSFGAGPHRCAGSNLARMNLRVAFEELLKRLEGWALRDGTEVRFHSTFTRSPLAIPMTFPAAAPRGGAS